MSVGVSRSLREVRFHQQSAHLTAEDAPPKEERPSLDDLEGISSRRGINQLSQHPPLYYVLTGGAARAATAITGEPLGSSFDFEAWFYRLVSIGFVAPLPLITWRTSRLLGVPEAVGLAAMLVPLAIPQYLHIGASANNDTLMMLTIWLLAPVVVRIAGGALAPRTAALAGLLTGAGLLTKGFALVTPLWVLAAIVVAFRRSRGDRARPAVVAAAVYALTSLAVGGWWWIRNVVLYGELSPSRMTELNPTVEGVPIDVPAFLDRWSLLTANRFWGHFGWYDAKMPGMAIALATFIFLLGVALACRPTDRVAHSPLGTRLLLAAPFILLVAMQAGLAFRAHLRTGAYPGLQGRYLFGALAPVAIVVALGLSQLARRTVHRLPLAFFAAALAMNAVGVATIAGFYWGEPGSALADRLRAVVAWAALPGEVIGVGGVIGVIVLLVVAGHLVVMAARPSGPAPPAPLGQIPAPVVTAAGPAAVSAAHPGGDR